MYHLDLFSGIGGFALACQWAGIETIGFVEIDKYCQKVLKKHWPNVPIVEDIRDVKEDTFQRPIDLITGGFPCQPFSVAGKRQGETDDRYLWPEMLRVIETYKPTWVLGENVAGIIDMALDTVLSDLGRIGYATQTLIIPACAVNAWHRRDRAWIIAHANGIGLQRAETTGDRVSGFEILGFQEWNQVASQSLRNLNGLSTELDKDRLKALGNAIVPQVAFEIIKVIKELD
jgi:DNA (cytosine-5)-methyltransferase 1